MPVKILMCSRAVPWPSRPLLGIFHVHQAHALRRLGADMQLFSPALAVPDVLGRIWPRLRDHTDRPSEYTIDGVQVHAPRVPFAFPPAMRNQIAVHAPWLVDRFARRTMGIALRRVLREWKPDLLIGHGVVPWARLLEKNGRRFGIPHAIIEHSASDVMRLQPETRLGRHYLRAAEKARATFVVGPQMLTHARDRLGWPGVEFLPNGARTLPVPPGPRPQELDGRIVVLSAANYYRRKGFEELVDAIEPILRDRPEVQLHLVTSPPPELRQRTRALEQSGSLVWHPPMAPDELLTWMHWADLFAMPSWDEAFGLVYAEALAQETAVLGTTDSGFAAFAESHRLERGEAVGVFVPPRDEKALRMALLRVLHDPDRRERMVTAGRQMVDRWFRWDRNAQTLLETLDLPVEAPAAAETRFVGAQRGRSRHGATRVDRELPTGRR